MSTQKIKSITIIKDFPSLEISLGRYAGDNLNSKMRKDGSFLDYKFWNYPEFFEIEYETPTLLKRPDENLIDEPEDEHLAEKKAKMLNKQPKKS